MAFTRGKGAAARLEVKLWLFCQGLSAQHKEVSAPALESHSVRNEADSVHTRNVRSQL